MVYSYYCPRWFFRAFPDSTAEYVAAIEYGVPWHLEREAEGPTIFLGRDTVDESYMNRRLR